MATRTITSSWHSGIIPSWFFKGIPSDVSFALPRNAKVPQGTVGSTKPSRQQADMRINADALGARFICASDHEVRYCGHPLRWRRFASGGRKSCCRTSRGGDVESAYASVESPAGPEAAVLSGRGPDALTCFSGGTAASTRRCDGLRILVNGSDC